LKAIENRDDVQLLVTEFYKKIRTDELLGPIFNKAILDWPQHHEQLTDFWESQLFFVAKFKGNPVLKHIQVDAQNKYSIAALHFGVWLNYWFETLDALFEGECALRAKNRARNMGSHFYLKIHQARPQ